MLDLNVSTLVWEIINFLIIAAILYVLVFKPIVKKSEARAEEKARLMDQTVRDQQEAAEKLAEINDRLIDFDQELQTIADEAYERNRNLQSDLLDATNAEAEKILDEAVIEARKQYLIDLRKNQATFADTIMDISADTIRKALPDDAHDHLILDLTKSIWDLGKKDMRKVTMIRQSLQGDTALIKAHTAKPLTIEQKGSLVRTFSALADGDIRFEVEEKPDLIAGIKVWIGDLIIDSTIRGRLDEVQEDVHRRLDEIYMMDDDEDE